MLHSTSVNRSQLIAAATALAAMGFLTVPAPARAGPMLPLPLAPPCSQFGFTGGFSLRTDSGWQDFMSSTGPATVGGRAASVGYDNVTKYTGTVSGGIQGRKIDITFRADDDNAGVTHYTGTVGDDGLVHNGLYTGTNLDGPISGSWDSINGPLGCTDAPPPAAPAQQPAPPDAQTAAARLGVAANGPTTLPAGQSGTYTVSVSNPGDVSAPVELFISFNGQLQQTGQATPSGGFDCEVRNYAGGTASVHCTVPQFQSKATTNITVQGRGSAPGAGQLVVNINSSDPGAQFVQKSQQLNVTIT